MTARIVIIASVEQSTPVSSWTEYLCLHRTAEGRWCLDVRGYEIIGPANEYQSEEGNLPDQIDGRDVMGIQDDWVMVDNLVLHSDDYASPVNKVSASIRSKNRINAATFPHS